MKQRVDTECYHQGLEKSDNTTKYIFIKLLWSFTDSQALRVRPKEETQRDELIIYISLFCLVHMPFHGEGAKGLEHKQISAQKGRKISTVLAISHGWRWGIRIQCLQGSQD